MSISRLFDPVLIIVVAGAVGLWLSQGASRGAAEAVSGASRGAAEAVSGARAAGDGPRPPLRKDWRRIGRALAWTAWLALFLLSSPWVANGAARWVGDAPRDLTADLEGSTPEQRALIVLSAGITPPEDGVPAMARLSGSGFERAVTAASVYHKYGFGAVIVSGRNPDMAPTELAGGMADLLAALGVPRERIHLEPESTNTKENARFSARMVRDLRADRVVVVTSSLHMPRAVHLFERAGLRVITAPARRDPPAPRGLDGLVPTSRALARSKSVIHELVGRLQP